MHIATYLTIWFDLYLTSSAQLNSFMQHCNNVCTFKHFLVYVSQVRPELDKVKLMLIVIVFLSPLLANIYLLIAEQDMKETFFW